MTDEIEHGTGYGELDWRLETYAAARLAPSPEASSRMRRAVLLRAADLTAIREFEARRIALEAEREHDVHRGLFGWLGLHRRASTALLAASLTLASAAAVFGASPGSALYPTRVWLEAAFVPAGEAGAAAHVDLLEQRVEDAEHAAGGGDPFGVQAALAAYVTEMQLAVDAAQGDPIRISALDHALQVHLLLLEQLEKDAPSAAQNAVHQAINDSRKATRDLEGANAGKPANTPPPVPTHVPATPAPPTPGVPAPTPAAAPGGGGSDGQGGNSGPSAGGN